MHNSDGEWKEYLGNFEIAEFPHFCPDFRLNTRDASTFVDPEIHGNPRCPVSGPQIGQPHSGRVRRRILARYSYKVTYCHQSDRASPVIFLIGKRESAGPSPTNSSRSSAGAWPHAGNTPVGPPCDGSSAASTASPPPSGAPTAAPCMCARPPAPNRLSAPSTTHWTSTPRPEGLAKPSSDLPHIPLLCAFVVPLALSNHRNCLIYQYFENRLGKHGLAVSHDRHHP